MYTIGIDPGLKGAIAVLNGEYQSVFDIPVIKTKSKSELACHLLYNQLKKYGDARVYLEQVHAMPGQGVVSMFSMGHTLGGIKGVIAALGYELHMVTPQVWKKYWNLNKDKELSRSTAIRIFPKLADQLLLKKHSDRAEALLIAQWGRRNEI
jgi:crossover junction endodeoxyribonuclease RuvC